MDDMTALADILNGAPADATDVQANFQTLESYINTLPRGVVGYAESTANQVGVTTVADLTSLTTTFTGVAGRLYKATLFLPRCYASVSGTELDAYITDGPGTIYSYSQQTLVDSSGYISVSVTAIFTLTGSGTVKGRIAGTGGNVSTTGSTILRKALIVEDIGAA